MKRQYGDMQICTRCGQDVQWLGRANGWRDRGNNRQCVPYKSAGEFVTPKAGEKHTIRVKIVGEK